MSLKNCFIDTSRACTAQCMAYVPDGKTTCRLLNALEKLVPSPSRPIPPSPPRIAK